MPVDVPLLRQVPLFSTLPSEDLARVAEMTIERSYDRGDIILLEGDLGGALYYVHSGLVKIFKTSTGGKEQMLRLVAVGQTFNDVPALDGGPNPASAAAMEPSSLYVIERAQLRHLIMTRSQVAEAAIQTLAKALRHLVTLVEDLSLRHVTARIAKILFDQQSQAQDEQHVYRMTQQEMAALAGTAREVVGRALKELEAAGAIEMHQGRVVVVNPERLRLLTSG